MRTVLKGVYKRVKLRGVKKTAVKERPFDAGHNNSKTAAKDVSSRVRMTLSRAKMSTSEVRRCVSSQAILKEVDGRLLAKLISKGELLRVKRGMVLTKEDDDGGFVYFILRGTLEVRVKGRKVAVRTAKDCVGEMSALDPTQKRCATLIAVETTDVLQITSDCFDQAMSSCAIMAKNEATELCARLRERSKFHTPPNSIPELFVGSSSEGIKVAEKFREGLKSAGVNIRLWTEEVFRLSQSSLESLIERTRNSDFAVLVLTPDDLTCSRGIRRKSPRDNVVFELGLFMGGIGRDRTYLLAPSKIKLPSDLDGITKLTYEKLGNGVIKIDEAIELVRNEIHDKGVK